MLGDGTVSPIISLETRLTTCWNWKVAAVPSLAIFSTPSHSMEILRAAPLSVSLVDLRICLPLRSRYTANQKLDVGRLNTVAMVCLAPHSHAHSHRSGKNNSRKMGLKMNK